VSVFRRSLPVRRVGPNRFRVSFEPYERDQLRSFFEQLRELLVDQSAPLDAPTDAPGDQADRGGDPGQDEQDAPAAEQVDRRLQRLFPPAYLDDPERQDEYHRFMHDELLTSKLADLDLVASTLDARELDEAGLMAWVRATNGVRLVLGTILDVQEDTSVEHLAEDDPQLQGYLIYEFLGMVVDVMVGALAE
jgi:hypothetical protein